MANLVVEALASSSAHGVSKAAASKSAPMRIMWSLLFITFLGFFSSGAATLLKKLLNVRIVKSYQTVTVPFEFPDLYFCPSHPFSGSYPYALNAAQADSINQELARLGAIYDRLIAYNSLYDWPSRYNRTDERARVILNSLPVHLLRNFLLQRVEQSVFASKVNPNVTVDTELFLSPNNWVCFQIVLPDSVRNEFTTNKRQELVVGLFIDPYFYDFEYSGSQVNPIVNTVNNESVEFRHWQPFSGSHANMYASGCQMLVIPRGTYPFMDYNTRLNLAPGNSYSISIGMEELLFSEELHGSHCSPSHKKAHFTDHLTGSKLEFNYSYSACLYIEWANSYYNETGAIRHHYPRPWNLRHAPRWDNLTEMLTLNRSAEHLARDEQLVTDPTDHCRRNQPCSHSRYYTKDFSFYKWPTFRRPYAEAFQRFTAEHHPALAKLGGFARMLDQGNHSTHSEALFRHFVSESMLEVRIRADSPKSAQVLVSHSYSMTAFLADMGGLLGLYIGSSLLTMCEVLELIYCLALSALRRGRVSKDIQDDDEVGRDLELPENFDNGNQLK